MKMVKQQGLLEFWNSEYWHDYKIFLYGFYVAVILAIIVFTFTVKTDYTTECINWCMKVSNNSCEIPYIYQCYYNRSMCLNVTIVNGAVIETK